MKRITLSSLATVCLLAACETTQTATNTAAYPAYDVPAVVTTSFTTQYPGATEVRWMTSTDVPLVVEREFVEWPVVENDHVARFRMNGVDYYAWYDANGTWIGTATAISDFNSLPSAVRATIDRDYQGYTITSVNQEWRGDVQTYEVEMKSSTHKAKLHIDQNGNVIKSKVKAND